MPIARILLALPLFACLVRGQFVNLVAPGDGANLYFSSEQPLKGSGEAPQGRIFRIGVESLTLTLERPTPDFPPQPPVFSESAWYISDYYSLTRYDTSRDGSVVAITGVRTCLGGAGCVGVRRDQSVVQGTGKSDQVFNGTAWLSGNGRYLFSTTLSFISPSVTIADLVTGQFRTYQGHAQPATTGRIVADNGTAVFSGSSLSILNLDGFQPSPRSSGYAVEAVIDSSGQTVLYTAPYSPWRTIRLLNLNTHEDRLFLQTGWDMYAPAISADGTHVTFIAAAQSADANAPIAPQLYGANQDGTGLRVLTSDPDGVLTYTLSDDGQVVWYISNSGRIVRLNVGTGEANEKISSTLQMMQLPSVVSPGSALELKGIAIPTSNVQVHINGIAAPILSLSASMIRLQVPWEVPGGALTSFEVMAPTSSPFDATFSSNPFSSSWNPSFGAPIHEDWNAEVSSDNPARPGEVIYFYATGLGPVDPQVPTGVPAPDDPPSRTAFPISCSNATLLYSGLAPGLIGYYQVSVQLPITVPSGTFQLNCTGPTFSYPPIFIRPIPVRP